MKKMMFIFIAIIIVLCLSILLSKYSFNRKVAKEIDLLSREGREANTKIFHLSDLKELPEPVQKYFRHVLKDGQDHIKFVRLKQEGKFRMKDNQPWLPITAEQYFTTQRPAFLWKVYLKMNPLVWIEGRDMYHRGKGEMLIKALSIVNVVDAYGKEMDISSLLRFLAEAPWFPTVLLPNDYIKWEEIDSHSARVFIEDAGYSASGIFTFNESGEIVKFESNDRFMEVNGKYLRETWSGYFGNYREINGIKIPTEGEVEWNLPDKDLPYAKLEIIDIQYDVFSKF